MQKCRIVLAAHELDCCLKYPDAAKYLRRFLTESDAGECPLAQVRGQEFADWETAGSPIDAFAEFCLLSMPVSEVLMENHAFLFHAAALNCQGKAFLLAGGSGVGKSTRCRKLLEQYPDEFSVINGDKPVLSCEGSYVMVHPSPWNGKEGWHGGEAAPLGGVFFLNRGEADSVRQCSRREAVILSFSMIFQSFQNPEVIRKAGKMTEELVNRGVFWNLVGKDADRSAQILYQSIKGAL